MNDNASPSPEDIAALAPDDGASLVRLASSFHEWEALLLVQRLRDAGVMATATGSYTAGFLAEAPGLVSVYVKDREVERATEVMQWLVQEQQTRGLEAVDSETASSATAVRGSREDDDEQGRPTKAPLGLLSTLRDPRLNAFLFGSAIAFWLIVSNPWPATLFIIGLTAIIICLSIWLRRRIL